MAKTSKGSKKGATKSGRPKLTEEQLKKVTGGKGKKNSGSTTPPPK